jgi:hypothetical protein
MSWRVVAGLVLAVASAGALNWGFFVQHQAAGNLPPLSLRRPLRSLAWLFRSGRWLVGFVVGLGGWALYVIALTLAPLSLVQATAAGGIALLAVLVGNLTHREQAAVAVAVFGLGLLGLSLIGVAAPTTHGSWATVATWMLASLGLAALAAGPLAVGLAGGAGLGIAAGVLYAAGDVGTKAAVAGGSRLAFVPALLACHGLAFAALQLGFQRGGALATAGMATLWMNALPIAAGSIVFGETLPPGVRGIARVAAFVCVVLGAAGLSRPQHVVDAPVLGTSRSG